MVCNFFDITLKIQYSIFSFILTIIMLFSYVEEGRAQTEVGVTYRNMKQQCFISYNPTSSVDETHTNVIIVEYSLSGEKCAVVFNYENCHGYFSSYTPSFNKIDRKKSIYTDCIKVNEWVNNNVNQFDSDTARRGMNLVSPRKIKFSVKREDGALAYYLIDSNNYEDIADSELPISMENIISEIHKQQVSLKDIIYKDETGY